MRILFPLRVVLYLTGGTLLALAPFLPWLKLNVLGLQLTVPGILWNGAWLAGIGALIAMTAPFRPRRLTPLVLLAALGAARLTWLDYQQVWTRGDYFLAQWQVKLAPLNQMLAQLNLTPLDVYHKTPPEQRIGWGFTWAAAALALIALGWLCEVVLEISQGASWISVLLGSPRCKDCQTAVAPSMRFCPGCGRKRHRQDSCRRCGEPLASGYRYCPACGESSSRSD